MPTVARPARRATLVIAVALLVVLGSGLFVAGTHEARLPVPFAIAEARGEIRDQAFIRRYHAERASAVRELLRRRERAVLGRDRAGFLATVDRNDDDFYDAQGRLFDNLRRLPIGHWAYSVDTDHPIPPTGFNWQRYRGDVFMPLVTLRYALAGFDPKPVARLFGYTFVRRAGRWLIGGDNDRADIDLSARQDPWDFGRLHVAKTEHTLVLGHDDDERHLPDIARAAEDAVVHVTSVWGQRWPQRVVLVVPADQKELAATTAHDEPLDRFAAVAVSQFGVPLNSVDAPAEPEPVTARVYVNPDNFDQNEPQNAHLLRHEVAHVAAVGASGPQVPGWLVEGIAEYVAYAGTGVRPDEVTRTLLRQVRAGDVPSSLPEQFTYVNPELAATYEGAYVVCDLIARTRGRAALLRLYQELGRLTADADDEVEPTFRRVIGTDTSGLLREWQRHLRAIA